MRLKNQLTDKTPLTNDEYSRILRVMPEHWRLLYKLMWATGITLPEALRLQKIDVDKQGLRIRSKDLTVLSLDFQGNVRRSAERLSGRYQPAPPDICRQLLFHTRYRVGALVFPYTANGAWLALKKACRQAGVRTSIHPGSFRGKNKF